mmetsp:Transcript_7069/g.25603  ORF Transcript_7069/g.25603 Transcript_7069/m.25603 type:complete len:448 (+) Transcript_7069:351-1694(+)
MNVVLNLPGHVIVDHVLDVREVQPLARHVGCNQHVLGLVLERVYALLPDLLVQPTVHSAGVHSLEEQVLVDGVNVALVLAENHHGRCSLLKALQDVHHLPIGLDVLDLLDHVQVCRAGSAHVDDDRVHEGLVCEAPNLLGHGGREEQGLALGLEVAQDLSDVFLEPHVDHPVRLVQHNVVALVQHRVRALKAVQQAARGRNHNLTPSPQLRPLLRDALPSHDANHTVSHVLGELGRLLLNLLGELSGWRQDDCIGAVRGDLLRRHRRLFANVGKHGKHKSAGLSRPGLRHPDHVPLLQPDRHGRHLDRARLLVPSVPHTPQDGLWHGPGGVVPAPERPRDPGPLERDAVVLPEDPPVPLRHLLQGLVAPAPVVAQARALAHPRELVSTPPAPSEEKGGLHGPLVQRIRIRRRVFRRVPVELELVPVARLPGLALLLLLPEVLSLDGL